MVREYILYGLNAFEFIDTSFMSHIMLCLGKCLICPWKEWLFTSCWMKCFSHIMMSNWLIVQISYILTTFIFTYPINYWKKDVVFRLCCCGSRVSSQISTDSYPAHLSQPRQGTLKISGAPFLHSSLLPSDLSGTWF